VVGDARERCFRQRSCTDDACAGWSCRRLLRATLVGPLVRLSAAVVLAPANPSTFGSCGYEGLIGKSILFRIVPLPLLTARSFSL